MRGSVQGENRYHLLYTQRFYPTRLGRKHRTIQAAMIGIKSIKRKTIKKKNVFKKMDSLRCCI